ncbi:MAG: metal-sensitive transcriptional regulator [Thermoleophilia bacterium]|nr:metal-sensitive transcriptional regulator [Thermoleophilia bacterium]
MATAAGAPPTRAQLVVRLKRAEGQLRAVQRMIAEGEECPDVLTQLAAVTAALDQVGLHLISERLRSCRASGAEGCEQEFEEAMTTFLRYTRLAR